MLEARESDQRAIPGPTQFKVALRELYKAACALS